MQVLVSGAEPATAPAREDAEGTVGTKRAADALPAESFHRWVNRRWPDTTRSDGKPAG